MRSDNKNIYWGIGLVLALIIGAIAGAYMFPTEKVVIREKEVKVNVPGPTVYVEKESVSGPNYVEDAVKAFLDRLENDDDYDSILVCDGDRYDFDQVSVSKVYDDATVAYSEVDTDDGDNVQKTVTTIKMRLKFSDSDVEDKCYKTISVSVKNVDGEVTKVKVL